MARVTARVALSSLMAFAWASAMPAQSALQDPLIGPYGVGPLNPALIRADAPLPHSGLPDPSLANTYNFVTPAGINLNGVGNFIIPDPDDANFIFSCTASRIGLRTLLTAAHCVTDGTTGAVLSTSNQAFARFLAPGSTNTSPLYYYTPDALQVIVNPSYHGFDNPSTYLATDIAVINFASDLPSFITTYGLFTSNPLGASTTQVGYGTYGAGTGPTDFDFGRRWGTNTIDYINTDASFNDYLDLYTDFDDPAGRFDAFCALGIACNTRYLQTESASGEGDSGGPLFVNGRIAGVTSFSTYLCTDAACDPYGADVTRPYDTFGALDAYAPVFANTSFIASATIPEPTTVALMACGLVLVGCVARRRGTH